MRGLTFQGITHPDDLDADLDMVRALLARKVPRYSLEKRYLAENGETVWINVTVSLVRDDRDQPNFFVAVIEDISARKRAEQAALHDPLTGLLNRRGISEKLERELNRSAYGSRPLAVAFLDLDGFKSVNDRLGHLEGDRCLAAVGRALETASRPGDLIGRIGGDEFLILLPELQCEDAEKVALRLREGVLASAAAHDWHITASVGLLCLPSGTESDAEAVISECDALMYRAKQLGRNRHVLEQRA
jgi:diguanylate cyclase (GGDEF)-like protein